MKVYARYFEEEGIGFRRDTILQFGDCWDLIGSIILINPGSAVPLNNHIEDSALGKLMTTTGTDLMGWKEFSVDPTMRWLEALFTGKYIGKSKPLNGIIQLFNLFNLRNQNLGDALNDYYKDTQNKNICSRYDDIKRLEDKPVYLGWGNTGKLQLKEIAMRVFESIPQPYLNEKFENNPFYHPRYLQMSHKWNGKTITLLHNFFNQNKGYKWDGIVKKSKALNKDIVFEKYKERFINEFPFLTSTHLKIEEKTIRIFFKDKEDNQLELVVTKTGGGYTSIRYQDKSIVVKDNSLNYISIGDEYNYKTSNDYMNVKGRWFCRQFFNNFPLNTEDELVDDIIEVNKRFLSLRKEI